MNSMIGKNICKDVIFMNETSYGCKIILLNE